ncbi:MAG: hypothetical protein ABJF23_02565 [Bryobacteraceae bacterium]
MTTQTVPEMDLLQMAERRPLESPDQDRLEAEHALAMMRWLPEEEVND